MRELIAALPRVADPLLPLKTGRKYAGSKADARVRVDENLGKLFDADVSQHFAGNGSRRMDAILWNYYGKPKLGFEATMVLASGSRQTRRSRSTYLGIPESWKIGPSGRTLKRTNWWCKF